MHKQALRCPGLLSCPAAGHPTPACADCREKAKGVTFFEARAAEAIRPMLDVAWAPLLGAFSVLFEEYDDEYFVGLCLEGFVR